MLSLHGNVTGSLNILLQDEHVLSDFVLDKIKEKLIRVDCVLLENQKI